MLLMVEILTNHLAFFVVVGDDIEVVIGVEISTEDVKIMVVMMVGFVVIAHVEVVVGVEMVGGFVVVVGVEMMVGVEMVAGVEMVGGFVVMGGVVAVDSVEKVVFDVEKVVGVEIKGMGVGVLMVQFEELIGVVMMGVVKGLVVDVLGVMLVVVDLLVVVQ